MQCHRNNGTCVCLEGIGGDKCDECARGYLGTAPHCSFCGECFKNWNDILEDLTSKQKIFLYLKKKKKKANYNLFYSQSNRKIS